jgi:hypothetical protein
LHRGVGLPSSLKGIQYSSKDGKSTQQPVTEFPESTRQFDARILNNALAEQTGFNEEWKNAYAQNQLPDDLSEFADAIKAAFNLRVVSVTPTEGRFDLFSGDCLARIL